MSASSNLRCPRCGDEYEQNLAYCRACGSRLDAGVAAEGSDRSEVESNSSGESNPDGAVRAIRRFGGLSLGLALLAALVGTAFLYGSRVGFQRGAFRVRESYVLYVPVGGSLHAVPVSLLFFGVAAAFGVLGTGGLLRWPRIWIAGLGWYATLLLLALVPPTAFVLLPVGALGVYWSVRGRSAPPRPTGEDDVDTDSITPEGSAVDGARAEPAAKASPSRKGSLLGALSWMTLLSLLLFWLPLLGPLVAGYVGGKKAGGAFRGVVAAALPAVAIGGGVLVVGVSQNLPVVGAILGGAAMLLVLLHTATLVVGALVGGALA